MPHSDVHKRKLKTNLMILMLIGLFCAMVFGITVVRMAVNSGPPVAPAAEADAQS